MKKILKSNVWLLLIVVTLLGYMLNFVALDVVKNDTLWQQHLNEKYETKYNEYKEFDIDLFEFEEELKEFEQQSADEDTSYGWDYFYVDTLFVFVPLLVISFGYSCTLLILFLFHKTLNLIKYLFILKATLVAYLLFYIPELSSNTYFLVFREDYTIENINSFNKIFKFSTYFSKERYPPWLWTVISDFQWIYILFPALVTLGVKLIYKQFSISLLALYSYIAYFISFVFYEIIMWYIYGFST